MARRTGMTDQQSTEHDHEQVLAKRREMAMNDAAALDVLTHTLAQRPRDLRVELFATAARLPARRRRMQQF